MKERFLPEDHGSQHAPKTPHVKTIIVHLVIHQQFWSFEISACYPHVVLLSRVVELSQPPVYQPQPPVLVVDHHVVGLHVPVHDAHAVAVVQGSQQLIEVASYIIVSQGLDKIERFTEISQKVLTEMHLVQLLKVSVVYMLENECWGSADWVLNLRDFLKNRL